MPMVPDELSGTDWGPYVHISYCGVSVPPNNMGAKNTSAGLKGRRLNGGGGGGGRTPWYYQWRFYVRAAMGTVPSPSLMVCPPPSCIALMFVCPSIIAQVQLGQFKDVDGWILLWR